MDWLTWLTDGDSNSAVDPRRTSPPTPSTTAGQHQPPGALAGEDGLGTTNDERRTTIAVGRLIREATEYRPRKDVGKGAGLLLGDGGRANENTFEFNLN